MAQELSNGVTSWRMWCHVLPGHGTRQSGVGQSWHVCSLDDKAASMVWSWCKCSQVLLSAVKPWCECSQVSSSAAKLWRECCRVLSSAAESWCECHHISVSSSAAKSGRECHYMYMQTMVRVSSHVYSKHGASAVRQSRVTAHARQPHQPHHHRQAYM
eukprot:1138115-Pelagomonas_calceolata.AAC.3